MDTSSPLHPQVGLVLRSEHTPGWTRLLDRTRKSQVPLSELEPDNLVVAVLLVPLGTKESSVCDPHGELFPSKAPFLCKPLRTPPDSSPEMQTTEPRLPEPCTATSLATTPLFLLYVYFFRI